MGLISKENINDKLESIYPNFLDTTNPKFLLIDNMYVSALLVVNYNQDMEGGFLDKILSLGIDMQLSIYYEKENTNEILKKLTYQIGNTGADIKNSNENQVDISIMKKTYNDAKYIREKMQLEGEKLYYINIYILIYKRAIRINSLLQCYFFFFTKSNITFTLYYFFNIGITTFSAMHSINYKTIISFIKHCKRKT